MVICCCITYGFITWFIPKTYRTDLDDGLNENVEQFISELEHRSAKDSKQLFDEFLLNNNVLLQLYNDAGNELALPSQYNNDFFENIPPDGFAIESNNPGAYRAIHKYLFSFADTSMVYTLEVAGDAEAVNQLIDTLSNALPWLIFVVLIISLIGAIFYSRYITKPVIKISKLSEKMSNLDFDWHCEETRIDELGILSHSLNELSYKLSSTLTKLQKANIQLKKDIDHKKELEQNRLAFFSAVSHELKTPITIIKGQLEGMILNVGKYKDRDKYLIRSMEVASTLENMVQEILTISRIESSNYILHQENFDFSNMIKNQYTMFEDMIIKKQLSWHQEIEPNIMIYGDMLLLKKVLSNLISNAIYYSPNENNIFITVSKKDENVQFSIENTGVHISEYNISKVFEAFYRIEQSRNRQTGGSGLGLYIVKMILEQHKAKYKIENTTLGVRVTIYFT